MASFRRLCGQEAANRLSSLKMIQTSRTSVYLNGRYLKDRFRKLKPKIELESLPSNSTDIFRNNIFDYYCARPTDLEQIFIYSFASGYQRVLRQKSFKTREARVYISKYDVWLKKRKKHAIVKYPHFPVHSEPYYYSLLLLLLPYLEESELLLPYDNSADAFITNLICLTLQ